MARPTPEKPEFGERLTEPDKSERPDVEGVFPPAKPAPTLASIVPAMVFVAFLAIIVPLSVALFRWALSL